MEQLKPPLDPVLRRAAEELEKLGFPAELFDSGWILRYVTHELREIVGEHDPEALGIDRSNAARAVLPSWARTITADSARDWATEATLLMAADLGGLDAVAELADREGAPNVYPVEEVGPLPDPEEIPVLWTGIHTFPHEGEEDSAIGRVGVRLHDRQGRHRGAAVLYAPALPGSVIEMVTRGDAEMLSRIASLDEPARHAGAILFCDLESSSLLSRRLPSSAYFSLIRDFTAMADAAVARRRGIVGRHAGDGVTAFFLARDLGSDSSAARSALEAAGEIATRVADMEEEGRVRANQGLHWSSALVVGRLVTAGRLEVTALGDAVNEAARIEQTASGGQALASKALVETLDPEDLEALDLDPGTITYRMLGEHASASEKARRDAGNLPVAEVV